MTSARFRILAIAALLVLCGVGGYFLLFAGQGPGTVAPLPPDAWPLPDSNKACQECHPAIYGEWKVSYHGRAWSDPEIRSLPGDFARTPDCWPCHAPDPLFPSGLDSKPVLRRMRRLEGVGCIACHYTAEGVAGLKGGGNAWCQPRKKLDRETSVKLCVGCHNQHQTVDEWKTSKYYKDPEQYKDCNDCHMPKVKGVAVKGQAERPYFAHAWRGGHDLAFLETAATVRCRVDGRTLSVEVENTGCGHNFPTDARHRAVDILVDLPDAPPGTAPLLEEKFRNPYKDESIPGVPWDERNTQIKPGQVVTRSVDLPPGRGRVRVRLLYSLRPYNERITKNIQFDSRVVLFEKVLPFGTKKDD